MLAENHPSNLIQEYIKNQVNKLRSGSDASVSTEPLDNKSPSINDKFTQLNLNNNNSIFNLNSNINTQKQINIPKPIKKNQVIQLSEQSNINNIQNQDKLEQLNLEESSKESYQNMILQQLSKTFMNFEDFSQQNALQKSINLLNALQQNQIMQNQQQLIQEQQENQSFQNQLKQISQNFMNLDDFQSVSQQSSQKQQLQQNLSSSFNEIQQQMSSSTPLNFTNLSSLVNNQLCSSLPVIQEPANYNKIINNLFYIPFGFQFQNTYQLKNLQNQNINQIAQMMQENQQNQINKNINLSQQKQSCQKQYIGPLTIEERRQKVEKYKQKKRNRSWKLIKYKIRQKLADQRERFQGRFIKQQKPKFYEVINNMIKEKQQLQQLQQQQQQLLQQTFSNYNQSEIESSQKTTEQNSFLSSATFQQSEQNVNFNNSSNFNNNNSENC